jgi:hypothetical protein
MTPVAWMAAGSVAGWALAALTTDFAVEVLLGMLGPLAAAIVSWIAADRTYRRDPAELTGLMLTAFAAKMVWFGAYVAFVIVAVGIRPRPFVVSFTSYFIALHLAEAVCLQRLFAGRTPGSRDGHADPQP